MSLFGVNEFGARFPVALATMGWFLATGLVARRVVGSWAAGLAGPLILAMFTGTFFFTHLVMPEPFLSCFLVFSFWALLQAVHAEKLPKRHGEVNRWLMTAWAFIALSTLSKGIHGLLIPVSAISIAAWCRPELRSDLAKISLPTARLDPVLCGTYTVVPGDGVALSRIPEGPFL